MIVLCAPHDIIITDNVYSSSPLVFYDSSNNFKEILKDKTFEWPLERDIQAEHFYLFFQKNIDKNERYLFVSCRSDQERMRPDEIEKKVFETFKNMSKAIRDDAVQIQLPDLKINDVYGKQIERGFIITLRSSGSILSQSIHAKSMPLVSLKKLGQFKDLTYEVWLEPPSLIHTILPTKVNIEINGRGEIRERGKESEPAFRLIEQQWNVYFKKMETDSKDKRQLDKLDEFYTDVISQLISLREEKIKIFIFGHADEKQPTSTTNLDISHGRADWVKDELFKKIQKAGNDKITKGSFIVDWFGDEKKKGRKVEILVSADHKSIEERYRTRDSEDETGKRIFEHKDGRWIEKN